MSRSAWPLAVSRMRPVVGRGLCWVRVERGAHAAGGGAGEVAPANRTAVPDMGRFIGSAHPLTEVSAPGRQNTTGPLSGAGPKSANSDPVVSDRRRLSLPGPPTAVPAGDPKPKPTRSPFRCRKQQEVESVGDSPPPAARSRPGPAPPASAPARPYSVPSLDPCSGAPGPPSAAPARNTTEPETRARAERSLCSGFARRRRLAPTRRSGTPDGPARSYAAPRPMSRRLRRRRTRRPPSSSASGRRGAAAASRHRTAR